MAILRAELKGLGSTTQHTGEDGNLRTSIHGIYDGIIETSEDLNLPRTGDFDAGSLLLCLANGKLYVKNSLNLWEEVGA